MVKAQQFSAPNESQPCDDEMCNREVEAQLTGSCGVLLETNLADQPA